MGYTFCLRWQAGGVDAVEREFGDGRTPSLCRPPAGREAMTDLCRDFGISRKTGYKIFDRYKEHGLEALTDRSRRPVRYASQLPQQIESLIVRLKAEKPHRGARKIRELLVRRLDGDVRVPAKSTIHALLDRHGLVKRSGVPRHRARGTPLSEGAAPNELWCADFKGEFKLGNGRYCYPLTVTDHASRFLLLCEALESTREDIACTAFERLFRERGLPLAIPPTMACPTPVPMPCSISQSCRSGGSGAASRSNASSRAIRNRTAATCACSSPSKRKLPGRRASTACSSRAASMPSFSSSIPNGRIRRST